MGLRDIGTSRFLQSIIVRENGLLANEQRSMLRIQRLERPHVKEAGILAVAHDRDKQRGESGRSRNRPVHWLGGMLRLTVESRTCQ